MGARKSDRPVTGSQSVSGGVRTAFGAAADLGARAGNLRRLAREYRRTERRAKALENVLLPEVEEAIKRIDEQLDTMDREEITRTRWAGKVRAAE
jgi:V/A-type H+-transporting ATPase subunit D